jgi:nucleotide-binding universal stress UspA family protein
LYKAILVPLDGSSTAEIVLPYVAELGASLGLEINLTSVSEANASDLDHLYRSYLERIKKEVQDQLDGYGGVDAMVLSKMLFGKPADEILRYSDETNADLIVMASRGSSGRGPWLLGNVAAKVLRAAKRPVLLIRAPAAEVALREKRLIKKILVPLDGSATGEAAITSAATLAKELGAELVLLRVWEPVATFSAHTSQSIAYLDRIGKPMRKGGLKTSSAVATGSAADQIIDYAEANAIDLIAMSTHGRTGLGRWVFGSVTDKVLHAGDTPVLVVHARRT